MREQLKNDVLMMLDNYVSVHDLREIEIKIEMILSNYEIEKRKTDIVPYTPKLPETVEIFIVSKKIAGLSEKTLYLYLIVLTDFFFSNSIVRKSNHDINILAFRCNFNITTNFIWV